jgi:hypothetical protein
VEPFICVSPA